MFLLLPFTADILSCLTADNIIQESKESLWQKFLFTLETFSNRGGGNSTDPFGVSLMSHPNTNLDTGRIFTWV